jgi:hypothetical protein
LSLGSGPLTPVSDEVNRGEGDLDGDDDLLADYLYVPGGFGFEEYCDVPPGTVPNSVRIKGDPRHWFHIEGSTADPSKPATFPLPCRGIVVGVRIDGDWVEPRHSLEELRARVVFARRKLRGYAISTTILEGETWTGPVALEIIGNGRGQ